MMLNDSNLMSLGGYDDDDYEALLADLKTGDAADIDRIYNYLAEGDLDSAQYVNQVLDPDRVWISNYITLNDVYFRSWALNNFYLTSSDSSLLMPIALSIPYEGGPAVYGARILLGIDAEENYLPYRQPINIILPNDFTIFPNPTSNELTIMSTDKIPDNTWLQVYNSLGQMLLKMKLVSDGNQVQISLDKFKSGIYICNFNISDKFVGTKKLIIIK